LEESLYKQEIKELKKRLAVASKEIDFQVKEKEKCTAELLAVNRELGNQHMLLKASLESPKDFIIFSIDSNFNYLFFNDYHKKVMKCAYGKEVAIGMNHLDQITSEEDRIKVKKNYELALNGTVHTTIEVYGDLSKSYYETFYNPITGEKNEIIGVAVFSRDVTEKKLAEQALVQSEEKYRLLYTAMGQGLALHEIILDAKGKPVDYRFLDINESYTKLIGITRKMSIGRTVKEIMPKVEQYWIDTFGKVALTGEPCYYENYFETTGKYYSTYAYSPKHSQFAVLITDITERIEKEKDINFMNNHDPLTGLYNRRFYEEELLRMDTERYYPFTIVMGDMNGLKLVNDSFGHTAGDELLKKAAEAMHEGCRAGDVIARIGGDEFVVLLPNTDNIEAERVISRIKEKASKKKVGFTDVSISFGYKTKVAKKQKMQKVFKDAEDYMYRNKLIESAAIKSKLINDIMQALFERSNREKLHAERVRHLCEMIAKNLNFEDNEIAQIRQAGLMHNIGNIAVNENVFSSTEALRKREWRDIKKHPEIGYRILSSVIEYSEIAEYVLEHHERWDGTGYPKGLKGEEISLFGRIIAVADAFDAMTRKREYKEVLSEKEAVEEIKRCMGTQFDPQIARILIDKVL